MPWWGHFRNNSLNRSHASYKDSSSSFRNEVISFRVLAVKDGGKYFIKKHSTNSCHVFMEPDGREFNHARALSLKEYGNNLNLKASSVTPTSLNEWLASMNSWRWRCGSSVGISLNWLTFCNIWNMIGFSSNCCALFSGLLILGLSSLNRGMAYCWMAQFLSSVTMIRLWVLQVNASLGFWFGFSKFISSVFIWFACLPLCQKVLSISRSTRSKSIFWPILINTWNKHKKMELKFNRKRQKCKINNFTNNIF